MIPFDLTRTPLQPGTTLIEASAGTGKTYAIAGLILRVILEERIPLREILAVTFTKAATEELRERVRKRLREAFGALRQQGGGDEITSHFLAQGGDRERAVRDLDLALQSFDEAQIFTIHGFCERVLRENAFESGVLFELELLTDPGELFLEITRDFWRTRFYAADPLMARLAFQRKIQHSTWIDLLERTRNHPHLHFLPGPDEANCADLSAQLITLFSEICADWVAHRAAILALFGTCADFKKALEKTVLDEITAQLDQLATQDLAALPADYLDAIAGFSTSNIANCLKARKTAPQHAFFESCEQFQWLAERFFVQLNHEFLAEAKTVLPRLKARRNVHTYDDLLAQMQRALAQPGSPLVSALRSQYRAALIDEFQDTDPVQYDIFRLLFADGSHHFFQIGDPKQAIYGFRGADVFTYFRAVHAADRRFTLQTNYRSEATLLHAINTLFNNVPEPFANREIVYQPLACGADAPPLRIAGKPASMHLRWLRTEEKCNQDTAEDYLISAVVKDIARLLAGGAMLGDRPMRFRDSAVLTRTNSQAAKLQRLLRAQGIPSVLHTEQSVFQTEEAADLLRVLKGVLEPGRDTLLKTALATPFISTTAMEIHALQNDQAQHQRWLELFLLLRERWEAAGFMSMFRDALRRLEARPHLIARPGGERMLTNYLHLSELLHQAETAQRLAPAALCTWLCAQINEAAAHSDEAQLRMESDEDAVTLVTIHKSKGLEYPVIFCPFLWKGTSGKNNKKPILFHDAATQELTCDLRAGNQEHEARARAEQHQEALRTMYVAVTRAQSGCFLYGGTIRETEKSALEHLLGEGGAEGLVAKADGTIDLSDIDMEETISPFVKPGMGSTTLAARRFAGSISSQKMIASFTSLTSGRTDEAPDRDDIVLDEPVEAQESGTSPLDLFERGVRAGVFLHDVLEHCDFQKLRDLPGLIGRKLASHGLRQEWREPLAKQIQQLFQIELVPGLTLAKVAPTQRLNEVEFSYPIASLRPPDLHAVFERHRAATMARLPESLGRLQFEPIAGYMRGFMDLLFQHEGRTYLVDWKSNWIGPRLSDYEGAPLGACLLQHAYPLQYHLYTVATDLFLRSRMPGYQYEKHFGGVFYIFLRGVDRAHPARGIFYARPEQALVDDLRTLLLGGMA